MREIIHREEVIVHVGRRRQLNRWVCTGKSWRMGAMPGWVTAIALIFIGTLLPPLALWAFEPCCNVVANPALKAQGRLVVTFPKEAEYRFSRIQIVPASGQPGSTYQGSKALTVTPGQYDIVISGASVGQVVVTPGQETHVLVGAL